MQDLKSLSMCSQTVRKQLRTLENYTGLVETKIPVGSTTEEKTRLVRVFSFMVLSVTISFQIILMIFLKQKEILGDFPKFEFDLFDDDRRVGMVQVRQSASAGVGVPEECSSHIYYEINEHERGKGYGKEALKLALVEAQKIGFEMVVVTCDQDNLASKRIIEANSGKYTNSRVCKDGSVLLRYEFSFY